MQSVLLARGDEVLLKLKQFHSFDPATFIFMGKTHVAHPFTQFGKEREGGFLFITNFSGYGSVYYANNELRRLPNNILFRNGLFVNAIAHAGYRAKWVLPVYKALITFALQVATPGGRWAARAVSLMSLATFWNAHKPEIDVGIELSKTLIDDLRVMYSKCPMLTKTMILIAMEEVASDVRKEIHDRGIFEVLSSRLDGEKYLETIATFFGAAFKISLDAGSRGGVGGWLTKKGFERLGRVAASIRAVRKYVALAQRGAAVARGPGLKDTHLAPTLCLQEFSKNNVPILASHIDCGALAKEGCLSDDATMRRLDSIEKNSQDLHKLLKRLTEAAEWEIF